MIHEVPEGAGEKIVVLERPEVAQVELRLVEHHEDVGNEKGEAQLEEHHRSRSYLLVPVVPVLHEHPDAEDEHGDGVEKAVEKPVRGRRARKRHGKRVHHLYAPRQVLGKPVDGHVEAREHDAHDPA